MTSWVGGRVLDLPALVDVATGRTVYGRALLRHAVDRMVVLAVPAPALTVAWANVDNKARLGLAVLTQLSISITPALESADAAELGELIERNPFPADVPDLAAAHVVLVARRRRWPVVTDRGPKLLRYDPGIEIAPLP